MNLDENYRSLKEQYRKLSQAIACSPASVIITDRSGRIEFVNPKFTEITGYSFEEVAGKNPRILKSGKTPPEVFHDLWKTIAAGREWRGEFVNRKKNGELYIEHASISPVKNEAGEITNFVAVKEDISSRRMAEQALLRAHDFLQSVIDTVPEPIMVIGLDYRIKLGNRVVRENGLSHGQGDGAKCKTYCYQVSHNRETPCEGNEHPCPLLLVKEQKKSVRVEHLHFFPGKGERDIEIIAAPYFGEDGELAGIIESSRDITERKRIEEDLRYLAHYDSLTRIPNRQLFYDRLDQAIARAKREKKSFALLFVDLDGFKAINDQLGHEIGDLLLKEVAARLTGCLRESDTVARMGGDEFTLIVMDVAEQGDVVVILEKIGECINRPYLLSGTECRVGASVGVSIYPRDGGSADELLAVADQDMYVVKKSKVESV